MSNVIKPTQARGEATLERILGATERLLAEKPFDRLSITEAAEMSVGNFYNRLPNKKRLLLALYERYENDRTTALLAELEEERWETYGLDECIEAMARRVVGFFNDRRHLIHSYVLHHRIHPESARLETGPNLRLLADRFTSHLHAAPARDGRAISDRDAALAHQLILALSGEFVLFSDDPSKQPLDLDRESVVRLVSDATTGICAKPADPPAEVHLPRPVPSTRARASCRGASPERR